MDRATLNRPLTCTNNGDHLSFAGWNTAADGSGTTYTQGQTFTMGSANITMYAKWTSNPTYTVTYSGNGSTGGTVPTDTTHYEQGQSVTVLGNTGNLANGSYTFAGWNTTADGSGTTYWQGQTFQIGSANVTLYAKWLTQMGGAIQGNSLALTNTVSTFVGNYTSTGSADGIGNAANFSHPNDVTTDGENLYVADYNNCTIRKVVISTGVVNTIAGTPLSCGTQDGTGANAQFDYPYGITTDGKSLYVTDSGSCTIRRVAISTGIVNTIAGTQGVCNWKDGTGAGDTQFNSPEGITTDGTYLYVADNGNYAIRMINIASGAVTSVPGYYSAYNNYLQPNGITTDGKSLYITDTGNFYGSNSVDKMDIATGSFSTVWADFGTPEGITTDGADLYVTDDGTSTVYKISLSTGAITTVAGSGSAGYKDGSGTNAQFSSPYGLTTDGKSLYVTDSGNNVIRKIQ